MTVDTPSPSPFAASLLFGYVANYLYDGDAPLAERRAQALAVDQSQLRELLGAAELRELLDAQVLAETELSLQGLDLRQRLRNADRLHDLLLRMGDLSRDEIVARAEEAMDADSWIEQLVEETRVIGVRIGGEPRYAAAEDAARLRDALGVPLPSGLPAAFLQPTAAALESLVVRASPAPTARSRPRPSPADTAWEKPPSRVCFRDWPAPVGSSRASSGRGERAGSGATRASSQPSAGVPWRACASRWSPPSRPLWRASCSIGTG